MTTPNYTIDQYGIVRKDDVVVPQDESNPLYQELLAWLQAGNTLTQITSEEAPNVMPLADYKTQQSAAFVDDTHAASIITAEALTDAHTLFLIAMVTSKHQQLARINIAAATSNEGVDAIYAAMLAAFESEIGGWL